jgi:hypothetical protein
LFQRHSRITTYNFVAVGVMMGTIMLSPAGVRSADEGNVEQVKIAGSYAGQICHTKIGEAFGVTKGAPVANVIGIPNEGGFHHFAMRRCDVLMFSGELREQDKTIWYRAWPKRYKQPVKYEFGRYTVIVLVNKENPIKALSLNQLASIYTGTARKWSEVSPGLMPNTEIKANAQASHSNTNYILKKKCLGGKGLSPRVKAYLTPAKARAATARDRAAIAVILCERDFNFDAVKVVPLVPENTREPVFATPESVFEGKYPLVDTLDIYLHPKASPLAMEYCEYACSKEAAKIAGESLLFHISEYREAVRIRQSIALLKPFFFLCRLGS